MLSRLWRDAGLLQFPGAAQCVRRGLQEELRQTLLLIANRLAVHFRHVAERLPLDVARVSHEEVVRFHRALAPRDRRLLDERLLGDDVRELIDELRHVERRLAEQFGFLVALASPGARAQKDDGEDSDDEATCGHQHLPQAGLKTRLYFTAARTLSIQARPSAMTEDSLSVSILRSRISTLPLTTVVRTSSPRMT